MGVLTIDVNVLCVKPITISQPGVQLSSGKRALGIWEESLGQRQLRGLGAESSGTLRRRSRCCTSY